MVFGEKVLGPPLRFWKNFKSSVWVGGVLGGLLGGSGEVSEWVVSYQKMTKSLYAPIKPQVWVKLTHPSLGQFEVCRKLEMMDESRVCRLNKPVKTSGSCRTGCIVSLDGVD